MKQIYQVDVAIGVTTRDKPIWLLLSPLSLITGALESDKPWCQEESAPNHSN